MTAKRTITVIPGDGIGPEVTAATLEILDAAGAQLEYDEQLAGITALEKKNDPLPEETLASVRKTRTPCVLRPATRTSSTGQRMSWPPPVTSMIWSLSSTGKEATSGPLRSLTTMATMPLPPRPLTRYS